MTIDISTPALLFSAISLIMLAQTNRFLSYAQLVRTLQREYESNPSAVASAQIQNLRKRLYLTRFMQVTGISSLLLCVVSMLLIHFSILTIAAIFFGIALSLLSISLATSIYEILISVKALEINLNSMNKE